MRGRGWGFFVLLTALLFTFIVFLVPLVKRCFKTVHVLEPYRIALNRTEACIFDGIDPYQRDLSDENISRFFSLFYDNNL